MDNGDRRTLQQAIIDAEGKINYTLIIGVCYILRIHNVLSQILKNNIEHFSIQHGQEVKKYEFNKLQPLNVFMPISWASMASILEGKKYNEFVDLNYLPILNSISKLTCPILILDAPAALDRYCHIRGEKYKKALNLKGDEQWISRQLVESVGWKPQNKEDQLKRRESYKKTCIYPILKNKNIIYFDISEIIDPYMYRYNTETQLDCVGDGPWHWNKFFIDKMARAFQVFLDGNLTKDKLTIIINERENE